jgi:hypothetical protein
MGETNSPSVAHVGYDISPGLKRRHNGRKAFPCIQYSFRTSFISIQILEWINELGSWIT